ncbi:AMFR (predicted) [Pycnogonum litorale]
MRWIVCFKIIYGFFLLLIRYAIHQWDINHNGIWENRLSYMYYSELAFEVSALSVDLLHHVHMLIWSNIVLSMASLIMFMQLRFLFNKIQRRVSKHKEYLKVLQHMETK